MGSAERFDELKYQVKAASRVDRDEYAREKTIPFVFDEHHDYMHDVDELVPAWVLPEWMPDNGKPGAAMTPADSPMLHRSVRVGRHVVSMPLQKYTRAVGTEGNVAPLLLSTITPSPEYPDGDDRYNTDQRTIAEKKRRGMLVLELGEYVHGLTGQRYIAWALAVAEKRRIARARFDREEQRQQLSQSTRMQMEAQKESRDEMKSVIEKLGEHMAGIASGKRRDKAAE